MRKRIFKYNKKKEKQRKKKKKKKRLRKPHNASFTSVGDVVAFLGHTWVLFRLIQVINQCMGRSGSSGLFFGAPIATDFLSKKIVKLK